MAKIMKKFILIAIIFHCKSIFCELKLSQNATCDVLIQGLDNNSHISSEYTNSCIDLAAAISRINIKTSFQVTNYGDLIDQIVQEIIKPKIKDGAYKIQLILSKIQVQNATQENNEQDVFNQSVNNSSTLLASTSSLLENSNTFRRRKIGLFGKLIISHFPI